MTREDSHHADHPHHVAVWREVRGRAAADWRMIEIEMRRDELILLAEQGFPLTDAEAALCTPVSVAAALGDGWFGERAQS